ncbi:MAG: DUF4405 domain-containing protein [Desulfovibrionaceae bacterium]
MNPTFRKTVSLTAFLCLVLLTVTSVVLYIEPHGRVAYWAGWTCLGLSKDQWGDLHLAVGLLFLIALGLHTWLNWTPLVNALKNRARQFKVLTPPFVLAAALTAFVSLGALLGLPPVKQVLDLGVRIKDRQAATYGVPPYAHAELSTLRDFAKAVGLDPAAAVAALAAAGVPGVAPDRTLIDLAAATGRTPQELYGLMRPAAPAGGDPFAALPALPPPGSGRLSLADFARQFDLPLDQLLARARAAGAPAEPAATLRDAAQAAGLTPQDLYARLRGPAPESGR